MFRGIFAAVAIFLFVGLAVAPSLVMADELGIEATDNVTMSLVVNGQTYTGTIVVGSDIASGE